MTFGDAYNCTGRCSCPACRRNAWLEMWTNLGWCIMHDAYAHALDRWMPSVETRLSSALEDLRKIRKKIGMNVLTRMLTGKDN